MGWQHLIRIASVQNKERAIARIIQIRSHSPGLLDPTEQNRTALLALQLLFCQTCAANIHGTRLLLPPPTSFTLIPAPRHLATLVTREFHKATRGVLMCTYVYECERMRTDEY